MRRREPLNVWPAIADLMTILAVPALCVAVGKFPGSVFNGSNDGGIVNSDLEPPKNERMYQAIQRADQFVKDAASKSKIEVDPSQAVIFGDDLVSFKVNSFDPEWKANSDSRIHQFCAAIESTLNEHTGMKGHFLIIVEGHTDSDICEKDPDCNWWISASRAAKFVAHMQEPGICQREPSWKLLPLGLADTRPLKTGPTRRIALRLVPDYKKIIDDIEKSGHGRKGT